MEKSGKRHHRRRTNPQAESVITDTPSTSTAVQTPRSHDDGDMAMRETPDEDMHMTVEEAMGMEPDEDLDTDTGDDDDGDDAQGQENVNLMGMGPPPGKTTMRLEYGMDVDDVPLIVRPMQPPSKPPLPMAE